MAGPGHRLLPLALSLVLLLLLAQRGSPEEGKKVSLEFYYESLCPFCSQFFVNPYCLGGLFENGLIDAVDLRLIPYGNAHVWPGNRIQCQHGEDECLLNTVEACAIDAWPDLDVHFPFIYCVEELVVKDQYEGWESCFQKLGLDPKPVMECYKSEKGHKLELKYANETGSLKPRKTYVPWVVVDGQPLLADYENFVAYICKAYKGTPPKACQGVGAEARKCVINIPTGENGNAVSYNSGGIELATAEDKGKELAAPKIV